MKKQTSKSSVVEVATARKVRLIDKKSKSHGQGKVRSKVLESSSPAQLLAAPARGEIIQFDWSRWWKRKVEPYLGIRLVRKSVELGMKLYDPAWVWKDGPHAIGRGVWNGQRVVKDKLSWYQPWGRCHWISFFACAIGVLNYPELEWDFVSGPCHTIAAGSSGMVHRVVMDILNYKSMTADKSISFAQHVPPGRSASEDLDKQLLFVGYVNSFVPRLRALAQGKKAGTDKAQAVRRSKAAG
jgi:hypothetical protein